MKKVIITITIAIWTLIVFSQTSQTIEFSIEGMTCQGCVNTATGVLKNVEGVESVSIDLASKKAIVTGNINVTEESLKKAIKSRTNFEPLFASEKLVEPLSNEERNGLDIKSIEGGGKIKFKDHLATGKVTIFDFYADWCAPCKVFTPKVERLLLKDKNIALRKVDLVDWKSKLAVQLTNDYKLPALPFTLVFDGEGNLLGKVEGNKIEVLEEILRQ